MFELVKEAWAMAPPPQGAAAGGAPSTLNTVMQFVPLFLVIVVFYFLLIRPQQKKQKELREMIDALKKGDKVITSGGIYGEVDTVKDNIIILKIADKVKIEISKQAVQSMQE